MSLFFLSRFIRAITKRFGRIMCTKYSKYFTRIYVFAIFRLALPNRIKSNPIRLIEHIQQPLSGPHSRSLSFWLARLFKFYYQISSRSSLLVFLHHVPELTSNFILKISRFKISFSKVPSLCTRRTLSRPRFFTSNQELVLRDLYT